MTYELDPDKALQVPMAMGTVEENMVEEPSNPVPPNFVAVPNDAPLFIEATGTRDPEGTPLVRLRIETITGSFNVFLTMETVAHLVQNFAGAVQQAHEQLIVP
jgi:hypothetical protein